MAKKSGQIAMEYLILVGFVLAVIIPLIIIFYTESGSINLQIRSQQVRAIGEQVVDKAESAYYLGEPTKINLKVRMPEGIGNITVAGRALVFRLGNDLVPNDVVIPSDVNISGSITKTSGVIYISVENKGNYVLINST